MFSRSITMPLAACLIALGACGSVAAAEDNGWYIGTGIGLAKNTVDNPWMTPYLQQYGYEEKTSATGFKFYGGYQFNPYWAAELSYLNLGKYSLHYAGAFADMKTSGLGFSAVGMLPLSDEFTLLGKAGALAKMAEIDQHNIDYTFVDSRTTTHLAPLLGVGAEYRFTPAMSVRAEYEYAGKVTLNARDATLTNQLLSLSLRHRF